MLNNVQAFEEVVKIFTRGTFAVRSGGFDPELKCTQDIGTFCQALDIEQANRIPVRPRDRCVFYCTLVIYDKFAH